MLNNLFNFLIDFLEMRYIVFRKAISVLTSLCLVAFLLNPSELVSQEIPKGRTGIYLSKDDLQTNNISMLATTDNYNFLQQRLDDVIVMRRGVESRHKFGEIGGYYKDGYRYRAFGDKVSWFRSYGYYKIIDDADLIIYSRRISGRQTLYFYSKTLSSPIKRIQPKNIKEDFAEHPEFVRLATAACKTNTIVEFKGGRTVLNDLYTRTVGANDAQ